MLVIVAIVVSFLHVHCQEVNSTHYSYPAGCQPANCQVDFRSSATNGSISVQVKGNVTKGQYAAAGLSKDSEMGNDLVLGCLYLPSGQVVSQYYWTSSRESGLGAPAIDRPVKGVELVNGSVSNGLISCEWRLSPTVVIPNGQDMVHLYLNQSKFYILLATGQFVEEAGRKLKKHGGRLASPEAVALMDTTEDKLILAENSGRHLGNGSAGSLPKNHSPLAVLSIIFPIIAIFSILCL
ncbi:hypothetical protein HDE_01403 [Halotydeus destructor]|nr:hypothetical protein HDE_01403 [Halotydeus destructor]